MNVQRVKFSELCQFTDKQKAATRAADQFRFTLYGGSRGPGKSYWLRWYLLRELLQLAKAGVGPARVGLFCEDYPSLKDRQISKIELEFPTWLGKVHDSQAHGLGFHVRPEYGGGVLALRNLDDPAKYQSSEFAAIGVDELTKNRLNVFNTLRGSLRWPGVERPKFVGATNPGSVGHLWVRAYWIDRRYPPEFSAPFDITGEFAFVAALPDDNPHLDPTYWQMLETLPEQLKRAWRYGEWDVFEGQVFGEWRRERHVCAPFAVPPGWAMWRGIDWGYSAPFACEWLAQNPDTGRVYVFREVYQTGMTDRAQARLVRANTAPGEVCHLTYADPSMWTKKNFEDRTFSTADEYTAEGVVLTKADNDRLTGVRKVHTLLADLPDGKPGLMVFENCYNLIRTLPALPYSPANVEDVDTAAEDHAFDALRYALANVRTARREEPKATDWRDRVGQRVMPTLAGKDF